MTFGHTLVQRTVLFFFALLVFLLQKIRCRA
jgi:hypothetical protein